MAGEKQDKRGERTFRLHAVLMSPLVSMATDSCLSLMCRRLSETRMMRCLSSVVLLFSSRSSS